MALGLTSEDIDDIIKSSQANNRKVGICGLLVAQDGHFAQALEGEKAAVEETFARISEDARHTGVSVLVADTIDACVFQDWGMASVTYEGPESNIMDVYMRVVKPEPRSASEQAAIIAEFLTAVSFPNGALRHI